MKAAATETTNQITPVAQVSRRCPLQAAMKNFPQRWITMKKKKASTLHRCRDFTKSPTVDMCHQLGPMMASRAACDDDPGEAHHREDAEHIDPRGHVSGLAIREQAVRRERRLGGPPGTRGPLARLSCAEFVGVAAGIDAHWSRPFRRGNGRTIAKMKTAIIRRMTTKFATDISMKPQWM